MFGNCAARLVKLKWLFDKWNNNKLFIVIHKLRKHIYNTQKDVRNVLFPRRLINRIELSVFILVYIYQITEAYWNA